MDKFGRSQPVRRREDARLVTGRGNFIDDDAPPDALRAVFVRAPVAHADIRSIDVDDAAAMPGVRLVLTGEAMAAAGVEMHLAPMARMPNRDGTRGADPMRPHLAMGRVRFVGQPVALVVAETLKAARDAAEAVAVDYAERPAKVDPVPGGPLLHDEVAENVAYDYALGDNKAVEEALAGSAHRVRLEVRDNRITTASMEPRGCWGEWDGKRLHLAFGGQGVWNLKAALAKALRLAPGDVRVTIPDVGGGFGMKGANFPEYVAVAHAARVLGAPVRWMSDRTEAMLSDNGGRDLVSLAEMGFDDHLKITAYRVNNISNLGAYNSMFAQAIQAELFARVMTGTYDVQCAYLATKGIYTNTAPVDAYRGAGRPEAIYVLERVMDHAARELGVDPWELRRRNFIPVDRFPYRSFSGELYDVGDFRMVLEKAARNADLAGFPARRAESEAAGRLRGLGLCYYIESILGNPEEAAAVEFHADGTASIYVGTQSQGQGHETVFAQFLSDQSGIPVEKITVVQGDSDRIATGGGTGGSRSATVQANATLAVVAKMVAAFTPFVAEELGVAPDAVRFDDADFRAEGSNRALSFLDAAALARAAGRTDLLRHDAKAELPGRSYPNGAHVAEVEVDPETGRVTLARYSVTDDLGNLLNPLLAEGQIHGGIAQGAGQMLMEEVRYDDDGQPLAASFMDYAMPRAADLPSYSVDWAPVPSTANPMGMKGCGEAGTVGSMAAVANAVQDALNARGVQRADPPFTPGRVWSMLAQAGGAD